MTEHLSQEILCAIVDGELADMQFGGAQIAEAAAHMDSCPQCTAEALRYSLLKASVAKVGRRFDMPEGLAERLRERTQVEGAHAGRSTKQSSVLPQPKPRRIAPAWAAAAVVLLAATSTLLYQRSAHRSEIIAIEESTRATEVATEVFDQHVAVLAHNAPPQVISSDRHTVKPWFQGKLPFSFNLPAALPADVALDGANLAYLHGQPTAQLLFHIGKHGASVFLMQNRPGEPSIQLPQAIEGFHLIAVPAQNFEIIGESDADPAQLGSLVEAMSQAQR